MDPWQLIVTPNLSGNKNMQTDLALFQELENKAGPTVLRFYSWQPQCVSLGYSQNIQEEIDLLKAYADGWDVIKRPTGGGIVFHNRAEVTYSLVTAIDNPILPPGMISSYKKISEALVCGLSYIGVDTAITTSNLEHRTLNTGLCFSYPAEYEVVHAGKKIIGSAQKRGRSALLQQGSIFVKNVEPAAFSLLKKPVKGYNAVSVEEVLGREVGFDELVCSIVKGFEECLKLKFV